MCEVTARNFNEILPELKQNLENSRFVSLDTEFSCLSASSKLQNSLFDTGTERYTKLRLTVEQMIPVQIGLTAFIFDRDNNSYRAHIYTFYVFPKSFAFIDKKFVCQSSSFQFLSAYKFDFNKLFNDGISYINRIQEDELCKRKDSLTILDSSIPHEIENQLEETGDIIKNWMHRAKDNDVLILTNTETWKNNLEARYFLHKGLRSRFQNLWTFEDREGFKVQKTTARQYENFTKEFNLDDEFISNLLGFSGVFRLLTSLQKPIIGHNLFLDLMVIIHNFEKPLPKSYTAYKNFNFTTIIPETKRWHQNSLQSLYEYFKDGSGRHLAKNSPLIEPAVCGQQTFHCAGWDSYCTGYIFIRMAHLYAAQQCNAKNKKFMSSELLQAVAKFKNSVNIIRGDVSHIQLDGDDPISTRPPWLIVETSKNQPINISQLTSLLSSYGFVEVKSHSLKGHRAIVAVDNFGSAKRILRQFKSHSDFKIQQYNALKHSPVARAVLWSSIVVVSGVFLAWYGYSRIK